VAKSASTCLDEADILAFATGDLGANRRQEAMQHVDECESCRALTAEIARDMVLPASTASTPGPAESARSADVIDGRFRLGVVLGRGAMGTVYRAHDEKLGTDVALKLLQKAEDEDEPNARAFARELRAGRRVTHPNVCRLHDAGLHEGRAYITMELVEGETLADILARGELPLARALPILQGVASGLAAAHAQGIVHRDLKPANLVIERETDRAVLTDFGFAADLDAKHSRRLVGTPAFWAPEQARGERPTPASDVYSFGLLAFRLLARREFSISDDDALAFVPRPYRSFIRGCLELRPSERPADVKTAVAVFAREGSRNRWWLAGLASSLGAIGLLVAIVYPRPTGGPSVSVAARTVPPEPSASERSTSPPVTASSAPAETAPVPPTSPEPSGEKGRGSPATKTPAVHPSSKPFKTPAVAASSASSATSTDDPLYRH
jgi:serine/threonine protein kinase